MKQGACSPYDHAEIRAFPNAGHLPHRTLEYETDYYKSNMNKSEYKESEDQNI